MAEANEDDAVADLELLSQGTLNGIIFIPVMDLGDRLTAAVDRAVDNGWIRLLDVGPRDNPNLPKGTVCRRFRVEPQGWTRRSELAKSNALGN